MIYIQSNNEKTLPHHFDAACAMYGAIESAQDYKLVTFDEVNSGKFDPLIKNNLFVGSVEFMRSLFKRAEKNDPRVKQNSNRDFKIMTLGEAKKYVKETGISIFIKPVEIKLFTGFVLDQMIHSSISEVSDETNVMAYDVFNSPIKSEFRCYVYRDRIVDIKNYSGDLFDSPIKSNLEFIVYKNSGDFPISYTIDIGILESGENVIIEYNDMWAIGNYGIPNDLYLRLLKDRYFEIMKD